MAVTRLPGGTVKMTADADAITAPFEACGVKLVVTAYTSTGTVTIRDAAGTTDLWTANVSAVGDKPADPIYINFPLGFNIAVTGTYTFILYVYPKK